jgi:tetratricopeptide (TPR) repeat protein
VLTLVRFGRFDEVLEIKNRPQDEITGALWDFAQGYAYLRQGSPDFARVYLTRVQKTAGTSKGTLRMHSAKHLLGTVAGILEGEIHRSAGDLGDAIRSFERAVELEDDLAYDEPEPLPFAARHWLGAALLEAKRHADAERVYRKELEDHPHNGWSLFGLRKALAARGVTSPDVEADFTASWSLSDAWIQASRY